MQPRRANSVRQPGQAAKRIVVDRPGVQFRRRCFRLTAIPEGCEDERMRMRLMAVLLVGLSCAVSTWGQAKSEGNGSCAALHLVPEARECTTGASIPIGLVGARVSIEKSSEINNVEGSFTASELEDTLKAEGVSLKTSTRVPTISFLDASSSGSKSFLQTHGLTFEPAMRDEGYIVASTGENALAVIAASSAGWFYGAQTVKQLIQGSGKDAVLYAPTIRDWPAMAHRGISDDWSRGPIPTMDFLKREIRTLAAYKYNIFSPYFEHTFAYASTPVAAFPGATLTPDQARELVAYAAQYHITIIPEQESFGHLHNVLKFEQYSPLGETPARLGARARRCQHAARDRRLVCRAGQSVSRAHGRTSAPMRRLTSDSAAPTMPSRRAVWALSISTYLTQIHTTLEPNHKQLLFWGDIAVNSPDLVETLPKDMIAVPWEYDAEARFHQRSSALHQGRPRNLGRSRRQQLEPPLPQQQRGSGQHSRLCARRAEARLQRACSTPCGTTMARASSTRTGSACCLAQRPHGSPARAPKQTSSPRMGRHFIATRPAKSARRSRRIMAAHALLKKAGLDDAQDSLFWADPFSPEGQAVGAKLRPVASELRLDAERAITLSAEAPRCRSLSIIRKRSMLSNWARAASTLSASKFQAADEAVALYTQAQAIAGDKRAGAKFENLLENIGSNNGKLEDIRDGYTLLRDAVQPGMAARQPAVLAREQPRPLQRVGELWIVRSDRWDKLIDVWWATHTLPTPQDAGLPVSAAPVTK